MSAELIEKFDALWDEFSTHVGTDLDSFESIAGQSVVTKKDFDRLVFEFLKTKCTAEHESIIPKG